ncbi:MAG: tryptophan-rich sensory protein, partial [Candidatus Omnitrophica bacterium]|nr:tryptophan-rich sensory protein [Candidatus Omnitrophota bacterium]
MEYHSFFLSYLRIQWKTLAICLILVYAIAFLGSLFTDTGDWYESVKPTTTPPNWAFPVVWNMLFFLIAVSLYLVWIKGEKRGTIAIIY